MPIISVRPCGPMHHEPVLRRRQPAQTSRVLAVNKLRLSRILPSLRGAKATKQSRAAYDALDCFASLAMTELVKPISSKVIALWPPHQPMLDRAPLPPPPLPVLHRERVGVRGAPRAVLFGTRETRRGDRRAAQEPDPHVRPARQSASQESLQRDWLFAETSRIAASRHWVVGWYRNPLRSCGGTPRGLLNENGRPTSRRRRHAPDFRLWFARDD